MSSSSISSNTVGKVKAPKVKTIAEQRRPDGLVVPLLYWLLVVLGLAGATFARLDDAQHETIFALWFGTIVGGGIGQSLAVLRVRAWVPIVIGVGTLWFGGIFAALFIDQLFGGATETAVLSILPAAVCGYLSLSERGALIAFWYPAMLWMLLILDGGGSSSSGSLASGVTALPVAMALGTLFIAFLRARETRRSVLWRLYGRTRLGNPVDRTVLRTSPLRGILHLSWSAFVGAGAFVLCICIAPHLWQKDHEQHQRLLAVAGQTHYEATTYDEYGSPCCKASAITERERVKEYIPLTHSQESTTLTSRSLIQPYCSSCVAALPIADTYGYANGHWAYYGTPGSGLSGNVDWDTWAPWNTKSIDLSPTVYADTTSPYPPGYDYYPQGSNGFTYDPSTKYVAPTYVPTPSTYVPPPAIHTATPAPPPPPVHHTYLKPPPSPVVKVDTTPAPTTTTTTTTTSPISKPTVAETTTKTATKSPTEKVTPPPPAKNGGTSTSGHSPWRWLFVLSMLAIAGRLGWRVLRRTVTLQHLGRPFWRESFDQRISNHWQRMLIGLRDAGIRPRRNEEPQAFAKRVGIEGMKVCATILERVRHGVRVDDEDLASMDAAATAVYKASRERAGTGGRVAAAIRWPLA